MLYIGIDVAKYKHECCLIDPNNPADKINFTISNNIAGFTLLLENIMSRTKSLSEAKVALEATGHYHTNLTTYLSEKGLTTYVINPFLTHAYKQNQTLRKTKTDKLDACSIAEYILTHPEQKCYTQRAQHISELKSLTRYRRNRIKDRARYKTAIRKLITIVFPEMEDLFCSMHSKAVYALLTELPSAKEITNCHLTRLSNLLTGASHGYYGKEMAIKLKSAAKQSIGSNLACYSMELKHTIQLINQLTTEISEIEHLIKNIVVKLELPLATIPGIGIISAAEIIGEIEDFSRFETPDQLLAFAGLAPTTYQSGTFVSTHAKMEKRGSRYLRATIINVTRTVCLWDRRFGIYLAKKSSEGKHYFVALSHTAKKLVRVIFALQKNNQEYHLA